jgi:hypothetical protein
VTKDQACGLKDGDVIYVIDDGCAPFCEIAAQKSPLADWGLQKAAIGERREFCAGRACISDVLRIINVTGYLCGFAYCRKIPPAMFFTDRDEALVAFEARVAELIASLETTKAKFEARLTDARDMIARDRAVA